MAMEMSGNDNVSINGRDRAPWHALVHPPYHVLYWIIPEHEVIIRPETPRR